MTKTKAKEHFERLVSSLENHNCSTGEPLEKQYNFETELFYKNQKFKLLVYFGKKGIRTVLQGNSALPEYSELSELISGQRDFFRKKTLDEEPPEYIGTDETGKGDIFGPLVVAAVYVNESIKKKLYELGVKDSKELNDNVIWNLAVKIANLKGIKFIVKSVEPKEYNELHGKLKNINRILDALHSEAVNKLLKKIKCPVVITDKFHTKDIQIAAAKQNEGVEFIAVNKAEKYVAVAAASILARAKMIQWFKQNRMNSKIFPFGSSKETEEFILSNKGKLEKAELNKYAKLHFKTWKKLGLEANS